MPFMIQIFGTNKSFDCKAAQSYASIAYLDDSEKETKLFENQAALLKQPVCRNGKTEATVGMCQKIWEGWK